MAFELRKLASGRTPDMTDRIPMAMNEIKYGRVVNYDSTGNELEAADTTDPVYGILMAEPNQTIEAGGGITFPLAASSTADVYPVVLRIYKDILFEADVTGTIVIANIEPGTLLDIDATGDGLVVKGAGDGDFVVEEVLANDGTNVTKVAGYFQDTQIGG